MQQYKTEENIDFFLELSKSLTSPTEKIEDNICLITNTPLTEHSITLECNHKFNYIPLVKDLSNHKYKFNYNEPRILKLDEIRCPYCRNIQKNLIPYYDIPNVKKIHGINFIDETKIKIKTKYNKPNCESEYLPGKCNFETTDISGNICNCSKIMVTTVPLLGKTLCYQHKFTSLSIYLSNKKIKDVEEKKLLADKAKKDKKILSDKVKADAKEAKKLLAEKAKEDKKILVNKAKEDKKILVNKAKEAKKIKMVKEENIKINIPDQNIIIS
jgi:hypothetical protein